VLLDGTRDREALARAARCTIEEIGVQLDLLGRHGLMLG
jgi:hypothetical protein